MISIRLATLQDFELLADLGKQTFIESHAHSASKTDIDKYVVGKYSLDAVMQDLKDENNIYQVLFYDDKAVAYSKIILNQSVSKIEETNITKLERLYVLQDYYDKKLGLELFNFNIELSKKRNQSGIWLFVWTENYRAIKFYQKCGFEIIGSHNFQISENHSNPNHQMFLRY